MDEILQKYEVRKSYKEKTYFINYLTERLKKCGYTDDINIEEKGWSLIKSRNIVVGNPETAKVIVCGHYDTCAFSPFPNIMAPTNPFVFIFSQFLLLFCIVLIGLFVMVPLMLLCDNSLIGMYAFEWTMFLLLVQLGFGFKNKHTANDNTSGVITLTHFLENLPKEHRSKVCVVYFDNEEKGLFGSLFFKHMHKKVCKNTLCINVDCIGDGNEVLTLANGPARKDINYQTFVDTLKKYANESNINVKFTPKKMLPMMFPSDQVNFKKGIGVCALKKFLFFRYVARLHTPFDKKCRNENVEFFANGLNRFIEKIN